MTGKIGIIMGSQSDWDTMRHTSAVLDTLRIEHEVRDGLALRDVDFGVVLGLLGRDERLHLEPAIIHIMDGLPVAGVAIPVAVLGDVLLPLTVQCEHQTLVSLEGSVLRVG